MAKSDRQSSPISFTACRALDDDSTVDVDEVNEDIVSHNHSVGPVTSSDPSSTAPHSGAVLYHPSQIRQWLKLILPIYCLPYRRTRSTTMKSTFQSSLSQSHNAIAQRESAPGQNEPGPMVPRSARDVGQRREHVYRPVAADPRSSSPNPNEESQSLPSLLISNHLAITKPWNRAPGNLWL